MKQEDIDFAKTEHYEADKNDCYAFRRGTDVRNGRLLSLGNMVSGYPVTINGVKFPSSECAYIAGAFSYENDVHRNLQVELTKCTNGLMSKRQVRRPNESIKRGDWEEFNIQWMLYVVWEKCKQNPVFRSMLRALPSNAIIIEDSTFQAGRTATVWGTRNAVLKTKLKEAQSKMEMANNMCKADIKRSLDKMRLGELSHQGVFEGQNIMGKILMICKDCIENNTFPVIDTALLNSKNIFLMGERLVF